MSEALVPTTSALLRRVRAIVPTARALAARGSRGFRTLTIDGRVVVPGPVGQTMAGGYGGQIRYQVAPGDGRPIALGADVTPQPRPPHIRQIVEEPTVVNATPEDRAELSRCLTAPLLGVPLRGWRPIALPAGELRMLPPPGPPDVRTVVMLSSGHEVTTMAKAGRPKKGLPPREDRIVQIQGEVCIGASGWWYQWAQKDRSITDPDGATHVEKYIELTPLPSVRA